MHLTDIPLLGKKILVGFLVAALPLLILLGALALGRRLLGDREMPKPSSVSQSNLRPL